LGLSVQLGKKDTDPIYTPEELVAMVLQHAVDISTAYAAEQGHASMVPPKDIVITVPSFATQLERMALLDAAALVDLNVLLLIDDNTAAALQYSMDKTFADATNEHSEDQWILFYNVGATSVQATLVHFYSYLQPQKYGKPKRVPTAEVVAKAWDATAGGLALDHVLVEHLANAFEQQNPQMQGLRENIRAMTKLRIQANKIKHVLSANADIPITLDALHNDAPLQQHMTRAELESLAAPLIQRAVQPALDCLQRANKTIADLTAVELIGGGMRVPAIQSGLQAALGLEELGLHMNSDESMALGAAFAGANHSTAFRVRHIGLVDVCPFAYQVTLTDLNPDEKSDEWKKQTIMFKSFGKLGIKKTITFTHEADCMCQLDYAEDEEHVGLLPEGTDRSLVEYSITGIADFATKMKDKGAPKIALQFELSASGIAHLVKAEASVEETYMAQEEIEVDDEEAAEEEEAVDPAKDKVEDAAAEKDEASESKDTVKVDDADKKTEDEKAKDKSKDKKPKAKPKKRITVEKVRSCRGSKYLPAVFALLTHSLSCSVPSTNHPPLFQSKKRASSKKL
jgi:hypoxia up-regulated 1